MTDALRQAGLDVVYDGLCRFCRRSLDALQRLAKRPAFRLHDANDRALMRARFPMLDDADVSEAMFVVTPQGEVHRGFFAYRRMLWESPRLYWLLPLFYAPGASLVGPRIYAWVARHRRTFGCSVDQTAPSSCSTARSASRPAAKLLAGLLGALLLGATLAPIAQNWQPRPRDDFPFSYYPMFSQRRGAIYKVDYLVGLDAQGQRHVIPYSFAGKGGFNQTRRQINKLVRSERADTLCGAVARRVAGDAAEREAPWTEIVAVHVVTGSFRFADYFAGNKTPVAERVRAACPVVPRAQASRGAP